jgi:beta-glucosidase
MKSIKIILGIAFLFISAYNAFAQPGTEPSSTNPASSSSPGTSSSSVTGVPSTSSTGTLISSPTGTPTSTTTGTSINSSPMDSFINDLMSKMTLEEKIGQLNLPSIGFDITGPIVSQDVEGKIKRGEVGGVFNTFTPQAARKLQEMAVKESRLKIPLLFGFDVIHGHKTIFPIPLGMAASWDLSLIEKGARIAATEASADGLNWVFSPMVDIATDPRWGRVAEGAGEDPYLGSKIASSIIKGYQGNDLSANNTVLACVKHFALYGAAEAGRDYNTTDMSYIKMYNQYLPPYKAAIDAGAGSVMSSFNEINGVPASANPWLLNQLLRNEWGFKGFVVSDYTAINEMIEHGLGSDLKEVSMLALNAGLDMDMVGEGFLLHSKQLINEGKVSLSTIDKACRLILEAKYKLGLFDDPYRYCDANRAEKEILTPDNRDAARQAAAASMVLLKNDRQLLPLKPSGNILVVGPLANSGQDMLGTWCGAGDGRYAVTFFEGIRNAVGSTGTVSYVKGCNAIEDAKLLKKLVNPDQIDPRDNNKMISEATEKAKKSDVIIAILGEPANMSGEANSRSNIDLPEPQQKLLRSLLATGKPLVLVLMNGRPLTIEWENNEVQAILEAWHPGTEAGNGLADVIFGKVNPSGKLTMTFPRNIGQIPIYYNHKNTGRPFDPAKDEKYKSRYLDVENEPLYPFGYGLSYSEFRYSNLQLDNVVMNPVNDIKVTVTVKNAGHFDGNEVVQLYIQDLAGSITRPVKELKGFQKVFLKSGESKQVTFLLNSSDISFYNQQLHFGPEPGKFKVFIGPSSASGLEGAFEYKE